MRSGFPGGRTANRLDKTLCYNYNVIMSGLSFEWDELKSSSNKKKHGLSFEEAKTAFFDENALLIHDPEQKHYWQRWLK